MEVCALSRGMMLLNAQSLSRLLPPGIRLLHRPVPAGPSRRPCGDITLKEADGLTVFRLCHDEWVRSALSTGGVECP